MKALRELLVVLLLASGALADIFEECNESNNNNFVASNKSCTHFIYCSGEDSFEGECPEENDYFNDSLGMCEPMQEVDCRTGLPLHTADNSSEPASPTTAAMTTLASTTAAPQAAPVTAAPEQGQPVQATTGVSSAVVTLVASSCPAVDNPQQIVLLGHEKSCTEYFICYHGTPLAMTCAPALHFNLRTAKCDKAEVVNCMRSTVSVREQCKPHTVDIYPHPDNCNYFYYCRNGFLMLQQCPFFYGWDYEKRSCVAIAQAKCFGRNRFLG